MNTTSQPNTHYVPKAAKLTKGIPSQPYVESPGICKYTQNERLDLANRPNWHCLSTKLHRERIKIYAMIQVEQYFPVPYCKSTWFDIYGLVRGINLDSLVLFLFISCPSYLDVPGVKSWKLEKEGSRITWGGVAHRLGDGFEHLLQLLINQSINPIYSGTLHSPAPQLTW